MGVSEQRHVECLREVYRIWRESQGSNTAPWLELLGEVIDFRSLGATSPTIGFARDGTSRADVMRYFEDLSRDWEMIDYEVEHMVAEGDRVAVLSHCAWRNRHTGKVSATMKADFFRFADGRVVEFAELFDTAGAVDAAMP